MVNRAGTGRVSPVSYGQILEKHCAVNLKEHLRIHLCVQCIGRHSLWWVGMSLWCGFRREKTAELFLLTYAMARVVALLVILLLIN